MTPDQISALRRRAARPFPTTINTDAGPVPLADVLAWADGMRDVLLTLLDQVDYTAGNCSLTEMVGACLPREVINLVRAALKEPT